MNNNSYADLYQGISEVMTPRDKLLEIMSLRSERALFKIGNRVVKAHAIDTDANDLDARLEVIAEDPWRSLFLSPIEAKAKREKSGRLLSVWPLGVPISIDEDVLPWQESGRLLAKLHSIPVEADRFRFTLPRARAVIRFENAIASLDDVSTFRRDEDWQTVCEAAASLDLPEWLFSKSHWIHGDWHLGQLVNMGSSDKKVWRLIDMEDMGTGHAVWDLARPAAFFAAGLLSPHEWELFLRSYLEHGGPAFRDVSENDLWEVLGPPAQALTVQCAAVALRKAEAQDRTLLDDEQAFVASSRRIVRFRKELSSDN